MSKVLVENTNLTNIANAIRGKNGEQTTYKPSEMATAISNIPSGGSGYPPDWSLIGYSDTPPYVTDAFNQAKEVYDNWDNTITNLNYYFSNTTGYKKIPIIPLVDTSNATSMKYMFDSNNLIISVPLLDTSNVTNAEYMFQSCSNLKEVPLFDFSKITSSRAMFGYCGNLVSVPAFNMQSNTYFRDMFNGCSKLETVGLIKTSSATSMQGMFEGCRSLKNIPVFDTSKAYNMMNMFRYNNEAPFTDESLNNILLMCINSVVTSDKKLSSLGLTSTQATRCTTLSNWDDFVSAGWSTGY